MMNGDTGKWRHLCIDMQRMFAEDTPWHVPWLEPVSANIFAAAERLADHTIFTRFLPPRKAGDMPGRWRDYYEKWWMMTGERLPADMTDLVRHLRDFVPPATVFDKRTYSPWIDGRLHARLRRDGVNSLVISGGESDVCVLATVLGGIDLGYRVVVLKDAVFSGLDETYDASLKLLGGRFSTHVELCETREFLSSDRASY